MKPFSDSPQGGSESDGPPRLTPQSVHAEQRREAVERSRLERLVHAKADGEISETQGAELSRLASDHARFAGEVKRTRLALDHMSILPSAPDFAARVLDHCEDKVQFTTRPRRRSLRRNRIALAVCCLTLVVGVVSSHRYWPGWTRSSARSEPLARVLGAGQSDFAATLASLGNSGRLVAGEVSARLAAVPAPDLTPAAPVRTLARDTKLKLGNTSKFDKPITGAVSSITLMASQTSPPGPLHRWGSSQELFCADDQWLLASLSSRGLSSSHTPVMSVTSQIMARCAPAAARFNPGWVLPGEGDVQRIPGDSYRYPSSSEWPVWPNLAD